jgi:rare lipoprotein A
MIGEGAVEVKVEKISGGGSSRAADAVSEPIVSSDRPVSSPRIEEPTKTAAPAATVREATPEPATVTRPVRPVEEEKVADNTAPATTSPAKTETRLTTEEVRPKPDRNALVGDDYTTYGLYRMVLEKPGKNANYGVQVASFSNYENVLQKVADLQAKWFDNILVSIEPGTNGANAYKVILGPFADQKTAQHYQESLASRYKINGFVLDLSTLKH